MQKSGGAQHYKAKQSGKIPGEFKTFLPKNRGCMCTPGIPRSYGPETKIDSREFPGMKGCSREFPNLENGEYPGK